MNKSLLIKNFRRAQRKFETNSGSRNDVLKAAQAIVDYYDKYNFYNNNDEDLYEEARLELSTFFY